jgi:hypothetical protein
LIEINTTISYVVTANGTSYNVIVPVTIPVLIGADGNGENTVLVSETKILDIFRQQHPQVSNPVVSLPAGKHNGTITAPTAVVRTFTVGDITRTGQVTSADATALARWLTMDEIGKLAMEAVGNFCKYSADLNGDGVVNLADLLRLQGRLVGLE